MPPKRKDKEDDYQSDEERLDEASDEEEVEDPDYQEEHHAEADLKKRRDEDEDDEKDEDEAEKEDDEDEPVEVDIDFGAGDDEEGQGGEEIEPPRPEITKNRKVVPPELRETSERMSLYEVSRVLGDRARHIDNKARPNVDTTNCTSSLEIAYMELMQRKIPFAIIRKVGQGWVEVWRCKEMVIPKLPPIEYFMTKIH